MCGVIGIVGGKTSGLNLLKAAKDGLQEMQHRGEEDCGLAVATGWDIYLEKGEGLVASVFAEPRSEWQNLARVKRPVMVIGHVRYSTAGGSDVINAQPHVLDTLKGPWCFCSNGDIPDYEKIRLSMERQGTVFRSHNDAELILRWIAERASGEPKQAGEAITALMKEMRATYSGILMFKDRLFAFRDPWGNHPLVIGELDGATVFVSETCVLDQLGAKFIRAIEPGEVVTASSQGIQETSPTLVQAEQLSRCVFELIYFLRPDSDFDGVEAGGFRYRSGKKLATQSPAHSAEFVCSVPKSGDFAAVGFSSESELVFRIVLVHGYGGRTFILPSQARREKEARAKYNAMHGIYRRRKKTVVVDDSLVRGTTQILVARILRQAGASEVHVRIASPPYRYPCHMGIDTPNQSEFMITRFIQPDGQPDLEAMADAINVDSLAYLTLENLLGSLQDETGQWLSDPRDWCTHCLDQRSVFSRVRCCVK